MFASRISRKIISFFSQNTKIPLDFQLLSINHSKDLNLRLHQYVHKKTNARIYHFENSDPQNAFASIVKTYVKNDTGCPHILQHIATCGSHKYPIRDPFFNMLKRSVNTYMNAWTGEDYTSYPFSSANPADWRNLYQVYLDMSLSALLNELDFRQQGWRYEIDENGNRELKGIVLNQMKGAYQDSDRQLINQIGQELFKGTPYVFDTGGKPKQIVNLKYEQLKKMYQYYYHPSNMSFFFYGNNPISPSLQYLNEEYLRKYENKTNQYNGINVRPEASSLKYKDVTSWTAQSNNISINYYLGLNEDISPLQCMSIRILTYALLEKSNAKIYQKFIESGIAQNIGFAGFNESKLTTFSVTLKGIYPNYDCKSFENDFREVLEKLVEEGIDLDRIKEFVHQTEVNLLTPQENNGIRILKDCMNLMNHRLSFDGFLNPKAYLNEAAEKLKQKEFLSNIIDKYFLKNERMVVVRQLMAETEYKQEEIKSNIEIQDKKIKQQQQQLLQRQNDKQDTSVLPILKIEDIVKPKQVQPILVALEKAQDKVYEQYHVKIEEDINFYRLVFSFNQVDQQFLQSSTLWIYNINRVISTKNYNYNSMTSELANHTAGFNVFHSVGGNQQLNIIFEFSCLKNNTKKAFDLISEIIFSPKFEKQHTLNGFKAFTNQVIESLIQNPMNQCLNQAAGQITKTGFLLNTYQRAKQSLQIIKDQKIQKLYQNSLWLNKCSTVKLIQHSNDKAISSPGLVSALLKQQSELMNPFQFKPTFQPKGVIYNYMVNFCAQVYAAPKHLSKQHAHINLLLELLQQEYLHPLIRQKGGAYGSGARIRNNGTISLSSYLDPNSTATFQVFDNSLKQILEKDIIEQGLLLEAKIKQFGEVDKVKIPQNQGVSQILKGYTVKQFDEFRQSLKQAKFQNVVQTGRKWFSEVKASKCAFGKTSPLGFKEEKLKDFLI